MPLRSVPRGQRVPEREQEGGEARVVEAPPALLPDPRRSRNDDGQHQRQPAGDDAGGHGAGLPRRGEGHEHRGQAEVDRRVEQERAGVQASIDRPVQASVWCQPKSEFCSAWPSRVLMASPSQTDSVSRPKATSPAARADVPGDGCVGERRVTGHPTYDEAPDRDRLAARGNVQRGEVRKAVEMGRASSSLEIASAVACASVCAGSGPRR